nr:MOSC domain-containing protein [Massilia agrisoli]
MKALTIRNAHSLLGVDSVRAVAGHGLDGDVHADALSPRQLLLAGAPAYQDFSLPPHALRENLLIDVDTASLVSGTVLQVGSEVRLRLMFQCEACGQLDAVAPGLSQSIGIRRGMLARVLTGGVLHRGDTVRDLGLLHMPWSDDWRKRIARVLDAVPAGSVIEYKHLARLAGVQSSYCRAFPRLIRTLEPRYAGRAVPAQSASTQPRWEGHGLFQRA